MNDKQLVAEQAAALVKDGMFVGLGTGSTANYFIEALARRRREDDLNITVVASSAVSYLKAQQLSLPLTSVETITKLDLYVDGADEVASDLSLLKGQGADLVKEKLLAMAADEFLVLVDQSKIVTHIGDLFAIPIEVMPFAWSLVQEQLKKLGGIGNLRRNADDSDFALSSHGSLIADIRFEAPIDPESLDLSLKHIAGIVEHGIFYNLATTVFVGIDGQIKTLTP